MTPATMQRVVAIIRLNAGNDTNGNPRRVYVALGREAIVAAWDEGYHGHHAVPEKWRAMARYAPTFATTPAEYRELLSIGGVP